VPEHTVLLLTNPSAHGRYVAQKLHETLGLAGIVVEDPRLRVPRLRRGAPRTLFVDRLHSYLSVTRTWLRGERLRARVQFIGERLILEAKREFLRDTGSTPGPWPKHLPIHSTQNINRKETLAWCQERSPDLLLVCGTSILKEPLIHIPRIGALNAHTSILPEYRGMFPEFWQVLHADLESAGVTVHFIDAGVDSGDVTLQRRVEASFPICPWRLRNRNVVLTGKLLAQAATEVLAGVAVRRPQAQSSARTYRARDITLEKQVELLRVLGFRLPDAARDATASPSFARKGSALGSHAAEDRGAPGRPT